MRSALSRFLSKVEPQPNGCWLWVGSHSRGYGYFFFEGRVGPAHRWVWEYLNGPVPDGLQMDHFACDNTLCANPHHVRPVTPRENTLRGETVTAFHRSRLTCARGHPFDEERADGLGRGCSRCRKDNQRRYEQRRRNREREGRSSVLV